MLDFTTLAEPIANTQIYEKVLLPALVANWRCRLPTSDCFHTLSAFFRLPSDFLKELTKGEVRDLASPKPFHAVKVQVLKETEVKLADEFQSKFPVVIFALSLNLAMGSGIVLVRTFAIVATPHLTRHLAIGLFYLLGRLLIELWRFVFRAVRTGQKGLVAIVEPCSITRLGFRRNPFVICCDTDIPITECVTFGSDAVDSALYLTRIPEPIRTSIETDFRNSTARILINFFNLDLIAVEGHRAVVSPRLELRRTFGTLLKEVEIPAFNTFQAFLQCPCIWDTPVSISFEFLQLRQVLTQSVIGRTLIAFAASVNPVMPTRQRYEVVMHLRDNTRIRPQMTVALMVLYLVFVRSQKVYQLPVVNPYRVGRQTRCLATTLDMSANWSEEYRRIYKFCQQLFFQHRPMV